MRISPISAQAMGLALLLLLTGAAEAAERFYMPYDCRFDGVQVRMRPTLDDRAYTIVGGRERQIFSSCAPDDPTSCRSWFVHRFDFQCDGARVSWLEAAGAAARGKNWDAWVADGRFNMRMGRGWGVAPVRPLSRRRWRRDPYDDFDRDPFGPGGFRDETSVVTLPLGFAPAMGIELSFSGGDEPVAQAPAPDAARNLYASRSEIGAEPPPATSEWSAAAPATSPFETTTTVEAPLDAPPAGTEPAAGPEPGTSEPGTSEPVGAPQTVAAPEPSSSSPTAKRAAQPTGAEPRAAATAPAAATGATTDVAATHEVPTSTRGESQPEVPQAAVPRPEASQGAAANAQPPRPGHAPTVINEHGIAGPAPETAQSPVEIADANASDSAAAAPETAGATPASDGMAEQLDGANVPTSAWETGTSVVPGAGATGVIGNYAIPLAASAAVLVLAGLAAFGLWWQRRVPVDEPPLRDIADISFDSARAPRTNARALSVPAPTPASAVGPAKPGRLEDVEMPTDYDEALDVLGANPDAILGDIKKIVDGLRRNWHPDHATSEDDRLYRERRLQQINVAWDLISKQRSAA